MPEAKGRAAARAAHPARLVVKNPPATFSLLTLGCPKNQADSEGLAARLSSSGLRYVADPRQADALLVNTCGFIEDAKRESVEEILRLAALKGAHARLVVLGCLAERYARELRREIPEVDAIFGVGREEEIAAYIASSFGAGTHGEGRGRSGAFLFKEGPCPSVAPLKVSEGCNRRCSYCAIPSIRGRLRVRPPEELVAEARGLVRAGAREIMLVAQDLTAYRIGKDYGVAELVRDIARLEGEFWVRPMYLHPRSIGQGLLEVMAREPRVCRYADIPVQHSEAKVLRLMRRGGSRAEYLRLVRRVREAVPDVTLRTTVMVGFPGEGEREFEGLLDFIEEAGFDRLGVFEYSREEGTAAASMRGRATARTRLRRRERVMELQASISERKNAALVGRTFRVLMDSVDEEGVGIARTEGQAPEVDGQTIVTGLSGRGVRPGDFINVRIVGAGVYDLEAEPAS